MIDSFIFHGKPIAAVRMTQGSKWNKPARAYLAYKQALGDAIARAYPHLVLPSPPPVKQGKERRKYNAEYSRLRYSLMVSVHLRAKTRRGDWDNYAKTVGDALNHSRVIWDDKLIISGSCRVLEGMQEELIAFRLEVMND